MVIIPGTASTRPLRLMCCRVASVAVTVDGEKDNAPLNGDRKCNIPITYGPKIPSTRFTLRQCLSKEVVTVDREIVIGNAHCHLLIFPKTRLSQTIPVVVLS